MNFQDIRAAVAKQTTVGASIVALLQLLEHHYTTADNVQDAAGSLDHKALTDAVVANTPLAIESATNVLPRPVDMPIPAPAYPPPGAPLPPINDTAVAQNSSGEQAPMNVQPSTVAETPAPPSVPAVDEPKEEVAGEKPNVTA